MKTFKEFLNESNLHEFIKQKLADHDIDVAEIGQRYKGIGTRLFIRDSSDQQKANEIIRKHGLNKDYHVSTKVNLDK